MVELLGFIPREDLEGEAQETELIQRFMSQYNLEWFFGTTRSHSQNQNYLSGYLYTQNEYQQSEKDRFLILIELVLVMLMRRGFYMAIAKIGR